MKNLSKVLIVVPDNLGDTVMATAVLRPLKRAVPGVRLGMFVKKYAEGVLSDHSMIDRLHAADPFWDRAPGQPRGGIGAFLRAVNDARRERYDAALILNTEWRRALAIMAARVPERVGYDRRNADDFLTAGLPYQPGHFIDDHRRLVETLAPAAAAEEFLPRLEVSAAESAWLDQWRRTSGLENADYTLLHPFSGDERKNWPLERWIDLSSRLAGQSAGRIVVVASESEKERLSDWASGADGRVLFLTGAPLQHVKAAASQARLMVGGDSGIGHVAAALSTPVLSLFGPGDPARSAPRGHGPVVVLKSDPLSSLSVESVEEAALRLLGRAAATGGA